MKKEADVEIDQEVVLDQAQTNVMRNAALMKASIENKHLREALKYASEMIGELKNPSLSPKFYYILCKLSIIHIP